jgi:hypothetical protein
LSRRMFEKYGTRDRVIVGVVQEVEEIRIHLERHGR